MSARDDALVEKKGSKTSRETAPPRGTAPGERTIEQLFQFGVIILDKPRGPTSHQVASWLKDIIGVKKAGHGGTLDPNVSGVLPVLLNYATKAVPAIHLGDKEYVGVMRLHRDVQRSRIGAMFKEFTGEILQMPPVRSAVKRQLRTRRVHTNEVLEVQGRDVLFRTSCEAGTYIRTLAHDIGEALAVGGHLQELRRTRTATLTEDQAVTLHTLKDAMHYHTVENDDTLLKKCILPMERAFDHLRRVEVKDNAAAAVSHGASLAAQGLIRVSKGISKGDTLVIQTRAGEAVAIGVATMSTDEMLAADKGLVVSTERVLMPEIFPKLWQRSKKRT